MENQIYEKVKKEYEIKKDEIEKKKKNKIEQLFNKNPKLREIEDEKNMLAIKTTQRIITLNDINKQIEQENLSIKLKKLDKKFQNELKNMKINEDYFKVEYECDKCEDTGFVINNGKKEMCSCFKQKIINESFKQANMNKINEENFNTFDLAFFSDVSDEKKYGIKCSPRENILKIKNIALNFAESINDPDQKNLLFTGKTGLGKTFLTNAIAKNVIENTNTVIYQTAPIFMDKLMEYKFSSDQKNENKEQYNRIFDVDLLIIDDLGTETMTNNKFTELFNIINTRLLKNKKILISTNLTLKELFERYDERLMSRIIGEFTICKFVGDDIRLKKKKMLSGNIIKNV